jgi:hypothetical protein
MSKNREYEAQKLLQWVRVIAHLPQTCLTDRKREGLMRASRADMEAIADLFVAAPDMPAKTMVAQLHRGGHVNVIEGTCNNMKIFGRYVLDAKDRLESGKLHSSVPNLMQASEDELSVQPTIGDVFLPYLRSQLS